MRCRPSGVLALVLSCMLAWGGAQAANQPDPYKLLVYTLLDLDQRELFSDDDYSPLLELKAWSDLYVRLREQAVKDNSKDQRSLKAFLLMGWIASAKSQFSTGGAFKTDFMELFEARPGEVLGAIAEQDFMLEEMCAYLARFFFYEDADPNDRRAFIDRHLSELESGLGAQGAAACLDSFWRVSS
jgi:hypothetical protein